MPRRLVGPGVYFPIFQPPARNVLMPRPKLQSARHYPATPSRRDSGGVGCGCFTAAKLKNKYEPGSIILPAHYPPVRLFWVKHRLWTAAQTGWGVFRQHFLWHKHLSLVDDCRFDVDLTVSCPLPSPAGSDFVLSSKSVFQHGWVELGWVVFGCGWLGWVESPSALTYNRLRRWLKLSWSLFCSY